MKKKATTVFETWEFRYPRSSEVRGWPDLDRPWNLGWGKDSLFH
jgi:hypothetical protein